MSRVVFTDSCPRRSAISNGEKPSSISMLAWLCHYGIITTNGKAFIFKGSTRLPSFIQFLFQVEIWREKYRKKEAVSLTTKFHNSNWFLMLKEKIIPVLKTMVEYVDKKWGCNWFILLHRYFITNFHFSQIIELNWGKNVIDK